MKGEFGQVMDIILSGGKWTPDRIKEARPAITLSCETIGHNLRRARRKGRVSVSYYVNQRGQQVAEYSAPEPQDRPETAGNGPTWYFYTIGQSNIPSGYFRTIAKMNANIYILKRYWYTGSITHWRGTHEAPILIENIQGGL